MRNDALTKEKKMKIMELIAIKNARIKCPICSNEWDLNGDFELVFQCDCCTGEFMATPNGDVFVKVTDAVDIMAATE
jgi:ribosomal protein S27E